MMGMDTSNPGMANQGGGAGPSGMQQQPGGDFGMMQQQQQRMIRPGGNIGQQGGLRQVSKHSKTWSLDEFGREDD